MNVRLTRDTRYASESQNGGPGDVITVSEAEGQQLIAGGYAVEVVLVPMPNAAGAPSPTLTEAGVEAGTTTAQATTAKAGATTSKKKNK